MLNSYMESYMEAYIETSLEINVNPSESSMSRPNDQLAVRTASDEYIGTCGESATAKKVKFLPAFRSSLDGRIERARFPNGQPAPMHLIGGLPQEWAVRCDLEGCVLEISEDIEAGFVRDDRFYTREEAASETARQ
jgi:hypothetical protein